MSSSQQGLDPDVLTLSSEDRFFVLFYIPWRASRTHSWIRSIMLPFMFSPSHQRSSVSKSQCLSFSYELNEIFGAGGGVCKTSCQSSNETLPFCFWLAPSERHENGLWELWKSPEDYVSNNQLGPERVDELWLHRFFFVFCFFLIQNLLTYSPLTGVMASAVSRSWSTRLWILSAGSVEPDEDRWGASWRTSGFKMWCYCLSLLVAPGGNPAGKDWE